MSVHLQRIRREMALCLHVLMAELQPTTALAFAMEYIYYNNFLKVACHVSIMLPFLERKRTILHISMSAGYVAAMQCHRMANNE